MKCPILVVLVLVGSTSMIEPDWSGRWTLRMDPDFGGNRGPAVDCTFRQEGAELTVKCGTGDEMKGTVRGRKATWGFQKTGIPPMTEDHHVATYTAEVNESGTALKGVWRLTSGVLHKRGDFEAKKKR